MKEIAELRSALLSWIEACERIVSRHGPAASAYVIEDIDKYRRWINALDIYFPQADTMHR